MSNPMSNTLHGLVSDPSNAMIRSYSIGQYANTKDDIGAFARG